MDANIATFLRTGLPPSLFPLLEERPRLGYRSLLLFMTNAHIAGSGAPRIPQIDFSGAYSPKCPEEEVCSGVQTVMFIRCTEGEA
jgi:hypothetical protein